ncbi:hypothetical protein ACFOZ1_06735 [Gracilibacillus marinus]|uniref:Uncharacterized protein n=1 Tax=Gracilibacillus marinus TaxID=630535 RepID=A0ABV8VXJ6_9BACI
MNKLLIVLVSLLFLVACGDEETIDIEGETLKYEEFKTELASVESELKTKKQELFDTKADLGRVIAQMEEEEAEFAELEELASNREQLESDVKEAQETLASLKKEIITLKDEPIKVGAGYFYFGEDLEPGRYLIKSQHPRGGNVFVRRDGSSYVNVILSDSDGYPSDYVFESINGDELEVAMPVELYQVE